MLTQNIERIERARASLEGLSVGDAFGETFFVNPATVESMIEGRGLALREWNWTDDSQMAFSIFSILRQLGEINQDALAKSFAQHYDSARGYGAAMHGLMFKVQAGEDWRETASDLFEGQGSFGNGSAMRVAPLGAYFADDLKVVVEEAEKSAVVTHAHDEAVAGAIAVAVAAALGWQFKQNAQRPNRADFIDAVLPFIPASEVNSKTRRARDLRENTDVRNAAAMLGSGFQVSCQDTVPFCLFCAGEQLDNYEEALWLTVAGLGDRDTTCAIVGGIVAAYTGANAIPQLWLDARETLPAWAFEELL